MANTPPGLWGRNTIGDLRYSAPAGECKTFELKGFDKQGNPIKGKIIKGGSNVRSPKSI